jgi:hypothetical protein
MLAPLAGMVGAGLLGRAGRNGACPEPRGGAASALRSPPLTGVEPEENDPEGGMRIGAGRKGEEGG